MSKKTEIVYLGHVALSEASAEEPAFLESSIVELINASKKNVMESAKTTGSYKFTLIVERMELPATAQDWNDNMRVIIDDTK